MAAKRELYEESGAVDFEIEPLCDYWAGEVQTKEEGNGRVFLAKVKKLSAMPESEMAEVRTFDELPEKLTYPAITPTRDVLVQIYQRIPQTDTTFDGLFGGMQDLPQMNYCKFRLALDIFSELGLVQQDLWTRQVHRKPVSAKVDLQQSVLLQGLQKRGVDVV